MVSADIQQYEREQPRPTRYAYVKNGDAVDQVRRLALAGELDRSGPDAFIGDFLQAHADDDLLVLCRSKHRDRFQANNLRAESFPAAAQAGRFGRVLRRGWSAMRIGIEILRWRPDRILCGCTGELLWVTTAVAKLLRVPIVNSRHNEVQERTGTGRIALALDRLSIRGCIGVVCHGPFLANQVGALGIARSRTHEFEVDLSGFVAACSHSMAPTELQEFARRFGTVMVFVGRVQRDKGVIDLLEAFCDLPQAAHAQVGLVYVGDGKDMAMLKSRLGERKVEGRVLLLGRILHAQLPGVLRLASIVIAPTRPEFPEGRCMVVLESLVLGVPVVAPNFGPFPYAIQHGVNGLLFEPGNVDALRQSLLQLAQQDGTLVRLRRGAVESGKDLLAAHRSFASAVDSIFELSAGQR